MKKIIQKITILSILFPTLVSPPLASAQQGVYDDVVGLDWILTLLQNVLGVALRLIGIGSLVMLVVGSFRYLTSGGDPKGTDAAKQTISLAIGGLVVAALAWFIFQIIAKVTGVEQILDVDIPTLI